MSTHGVWLKSNNNEVLIFTGTVGECHRYVFVETAKNSALKSNLRFAALPRHRVAIGNGGNEIIVGAFDNEDDAMNFAQGYLSAYGEEFDEKSLSIS